MDLIVVGFRGKHRAAEVLSQLQELSEDWVVDLQDAVAAYRTDSGRLRTDSSYQMTSGEGAAAGGILGLLLGGILMAPFTAGLSAGAAAAAVGSGAAFAGATGAALAGMDAEDWKDEYGISEDFVKNVGGMVQPGDSAVFALLHSVAPQQLAERFRGYGGKVLWTNLSPESQAKLKHMLTEH